MQLKPVKKFVDKHVYHKPQVKAKQSKAKMKRKKKSIYRQPQTDKINPTTKTSVTTQTINK